MNEFVCFNGFLIKFWDISSFVYFLQMFKYFFNVSIFEKIWFYCWCNKFFVLSGDMDLSLSLCKISFEYFYDFLSSICLSLYLWCSVGIKGFLPFFNAHSFISNIYFFNLSCFKFRILISKYKNASFWAPLLIAHANTSSSEDSLV